jgi:uncharacterized protein
VITYVDTSVLIKMLVGEHGSPEAAQLWDRADTVATCRLTYVETTAALAAAHGAERLDEDAERAARRGLEHLWDQCYVVEADEALASQAALLARAEQLRGYDAVHLAAALSIHAVVLASADRDLCRAAAARGLYVADPTATSER